MDNIGATHQVGDVNKLVRPVSIGNVARTEHDCGGWQRFGVQPGLAPVGHPVIRPAADNPGDRGNGRMNRIGTQRRIPDGLLQLDTSARGVQIRT